MMRKQFVGLVTYDAKADAAYIYFRPGGREGREKVSYTLQLARNIYGDFDHDRRLIGIELLEKDFLPEELQGLFNEVI